MGHPATITGDICYLARVVQSALFGLLFQVLGQRPKYFMKAALEDLTTLLQRGADVLGMESVHCSETSFKSGDGSVSWHYCFQHCYFFEGVHSFCRTGWNWSGALMILILCPGGNITQGHWRGLEVIFLSAWAQCAYWLALCEKASHLCYRIVMIGTASLPHLLMLVLGSQDPASWYCSNELY